MQFVTQVLHRRSSDGCGWGSSKCGMCTVSCLGFHRLSWYLWFRVVGATEWGRSSAQFVHLVFVFAVCAMDSALLELVHADCVTQHRNDAFQNRVVTFLVE